MRVRHESSNRWKLLKAAATFGSVGAACSGSYKPGEA